jgi:Ca-activated chloride channel family protein
VIRSAACFLISALSLAAQASPQDTVVFRSNVRLVPMLVTVKDSNGQLITSLNKGDFTIFDNGVKQDVAVFERQTEQPLSVSVLVDTSGSTGIELHYELDSVSKFFRALVGSGNPRDSAALYSFSGEVRVEKSFTRNLASLDRQLKLLRSGGGTSLYDAIYLASQELELRDGRHVIVVVTDGGDTTSYKDYHHALQSAQLADAVMNPSPKGHVATRDPPA